MAGLKSSAVFTNGIVSCDTTDLLQQAFQGVVDSDNHENEFVTFLQDEDDEGQPIHLTQAQASALRLTFEVDPSVDDQGDDINYHQDQNVTLEDIQRVTEDLANQAQQHESLEQLQFESDEQWIEDTDDNCRIEESLEENQMQVEALEIPQEEVPEKLIEQYQEVSLQNNIETIFSQDQLLQGKKINIQQNFNGIQNAFTSNGTQETQIPQRLPHVLPSTYIIRPIQTLLKNAKSIRLVPNGNKIEGSINAQENPNQNSLFLQKNTNLNGLNYQIMKGSGLATQLINGNSISTQLLDTSQILTTCDMNGSNGTIQSPQNFTNTQFRTTNFIKTPTTSIQRLNNGNVQKLVTTLAKNNEVVSGNKNGISNGKNSIPASFFKSVQVPTQLVKTSGVSTVRTSMKPANTTNSQFLFRSAGSCLKPQDMKTIASSIGSTVRSTSQTISSPISILKPQKFTLTNTNNQNMNKIQNNKLIKKVPTPQQNPAFLPIEKKINQNGTNKIVNKVEDLSTAKAAKKTKLSGVQNAVNTGDTSKPLGSSENPIQIVQQGQTFHSMQKLTQTQLKQIAHVLQQRSQESSNSNERVVYRVVFPEELDLRIRNPSNLIKGRGGKRGRPKKTTGRHPTPTNKPTAVEEEAEESKEDRKKVVARTRSGRLSRPPRHMIRDYKHLHHLDFTQPDMDDSDGGYSDYNTNNDKNETLDSTKELLSGLEVPKRKISDHFRCPTCNKIYLGRTRMAKHFEVHPDHGSPEQLPPTNLNTSTNADLKRTSISADPFKRKGKKRGPWAYVTPEAKSERRQTKLREAISVCESNEILKIAAKPVLNAQSLFDLMAIKSENNVQNFLDELKVLMETIREKAGIMLSPMMNGEKDRSSVELKEELLCDALGLSPGFYAINEGAFEKPEPFQELETSISEEPPMKLQKIRSDECKENIEERMSSGFSESSDLSVSDFLNDRKIEAVNSNCPEVLTALTLMPRNPSPVIEGNMKNNNVSKLLISNPEIQSQISDNPGFQKIDISASKHGNSQFRKIEPIKEGGFIKLGEGLDISNCSTVFTKLEESYEQSKLDSIQQAFIKLEPMNQGFVKLENGTINTYQEASSHTFSKLDNGFGNLEEGTQTFSKGFQKLISKIVPMNSDINSKVDCLNDSKVVCKIADSLPILQDTVPIMTTTCDTSIFGSTDNLDHITHLDILGNSGVMDKHLMMDEKLVAMHLVDQSSLVDELVSERLKNIMPDNILENNLMPNNTSLDTDLDFEALSEEFNRNTRS